jgi:hypothetical protein
MFGTLFCVATAVLGIDIGWEPNAEGNTEYIIQLSPGMAEAMFRGQAVRFDLPPEHQGVRHFRFQVGQEALPQAGTPAASPVGRVEAAVKELQSAPESSAGPPARPTADAVEPWKLPVTPVPEEPDPFEPPAALDSQQQPHPPAKTFPSPISRVAPDDTGTAFIREHKAVFNQPVGGQSPTLPGRQQPSNEDALLVPLIVVSTTAAGLLVAFLYLCWIHLGTRRRYRALLGEYYAASSMAS